MPSTIEQRILEMRFDNNNFERNAKQSMDTLDKLDDKLKLREGSVSFDKFGDMIEAVTSKFSILGTIGDQVIRRITNSVYDLTLKMTGLVKSLSVDQIAAGWDKYGKMTTSSGTLVAQGYDLEVVEKQLERLNWFTDETSYNLTDMVDNISKFTATGQDLESSVTAMEGIALWAALSGQNASTASRAMYQLSQAMTNYMRKEDYKSIQNANMDTDEFRQTALDTAVAMGKLQKNADGTYRSLVSAGKKVQDFTKAQFVDHLTEDAWFTSDVMMEVFKKYSAAVDQIYEYSDEKGITASDAIRQLEGRIDSFGLKAFKAGQEARTLTDAIDSVKDAVSTGWLNTFKTIFGDYSESTELWTNLANSLYDLFAEGGNQRNLLLEGWRHYDPFGGARKAESPKGRQFFLDDQDALDYSGVIDGRDILLNALTTLGTSGISILDSIKAGFRDIFPETTVKDLIDLTKAFEDFAKKLKPSEATLDKIERIFKGLFSIVDIGRMAIIALANSFKENLSPSLDSCVGTLFDAVVSAADWVSNIRDSIKENDLFSKSLSDLVGYFKPLTDWIKKATTSIKEFIKNNTWLEVISSTWNSILSVLKTVFTYISEKAAVVGSALRTAFSDRNLGSNIIKILGGILAAFLGFKKISNIGKNPISEFFESMKKVFSGGVGSIVKSINDLFNGLGSAIKSFTNNTNAKLLMNIAIALGIFTASLVVLSAIDGDKLAASVFTVAGALAELLLALKAVSMIEGAGIQKATRGLITLAASILLLSLSVKILSDIEPDKIAVGLLGMTVSLLAMVLALKLISNNVDPKATANILAAGAAMMGMALAMLVMSASIAIFAFIPFEKLVQGLEAFVGVIIVVSASLGLLSKFADPVGMIAAAASLLLISAAMVIFAAAIAVFAFIPYDNLAQGIGAFGVVLIVMVVALTALSAISAGVIVSAAALLLLSAAMLGLAVAVALLSAIPYDNLVKGITAMGAVLLIMVAALVVLGTVAGPAIVAAAALLVLSVALLATAAALVIMAGGLAALAAIGGGAVIADIGFGLAILGAALVVLAVGSAAMALGLVGVGALAVLAVGLNLLVGIPLASIAGGLTLLGLALIPLAAGGAVLTVASVGLLAGSVAIGALSLALPPLAKALHKFDDIDKDTIIKFIEVLGVSVLALAGLGVIAEAFATGFLVLGTACITAGAGIKMAGEGVALIVDSILSIPDKATARLSEMAKALADVLLDKGEQATSAMETVMNDIVNTVEEAIPQAKSASERFAIGISEGVLTNTSEVASAFKTVLDRCITVFKQYESTFKGVGAGEIRAFASGFYGASNDVGNAAISVTYSAASYINQQSNNFKTAGYNITVGVANGIYNGFYTPVNAVAQMSEQMYEVFVQYWGIHSPSKLMERLSENIAIGAGRGVAAESDYASSAIEDMGDEMIMALSPALAIIAGLLDGTFDFTPTVRPVVDMSDIYSRSSEIGEMFSSANVGAYVSAHDVRVNDASTVSSDPKSEGINNGAFNPTFNIYTQPGQNVEEIADAVERKLVDVYRQRKVAGVV